MVYIHIPFCIKKCLYCDFYSITDKSLIKAYTDSLIGEIKSHRGEKTETVYIGGGTPTSIGDELLRIVDAVRENFVFSENYEFTIEANPGATDERVFKALFEKGVNRISLGVQSFNNDELKALGRIHTAEDALSAVEMIKSAGFNNFSIDLMFAIPGQTKESLLRNLEKVKKINPPHISVYSLILEEGTPLYDMDIELPDEDTEREMYYLIGEELSKIGLNRYEISNFAKQGFESRHNSGYWKDCEYIGLGAGAHSYKDKTRYENVSDVCLYISGQGRKINAVKISDKERQLELFMLGLRMTDGVLYNGEFPERVNPLIEKGLLKTENGRLKLTDKGTDLGNIVFMEFLDD